MRDRVDLGRVDVGDTRPDEVEAAVEVVSRAMPTARWRSPWLAGATSSAPTRWREAGALAPAPRDL